MNITYREITEDDLEQRVDWFNDKEVGQYLGDSVREGTTLEKQREWLKKYQQDDERICYVIEVDDKPVGNVALIEINKTDENAGIFIMIGDKNYWGKGVAKDALKFITDYGFQKLGMHKIWLHVFSPNERAIRCYEKFGFITEARHTEMVKLDGAFHDEIFMTITNPGLS